MSVLPVHRRHLSASSRSHGSGRWGEKYILLVIFLAFGAVCFGAFLFVPDTSFRDRLSMWEKHKDIPLQQALGAFQVQPPKHDHNHFGVNVNDQNNQQAESSSIHSKPGTSTSEDAQRQSQQQNGSPSRGTEPQSAQSPSQQASQPAHTLSPAELENTKRREFIKQMTKHAWAGYEKFAMGQNELKPLSRTGHSAAIFGGSPLGATIVDSLDTLYIMGLIEEYGRARRWVQDHLTFNVPSQISVFEMTIRFVGGLLSAHALTKDELFKTKAVELAKKILPAFNSPSGLPYASINLNSGATRNWHWALGGCSVLAEVGTLHLEFAYLSKITGDPIYLQKVEKARDVLEKIDKPNGLYYNFVHPSTSQWCQRHVSMGALGDSFYEYLIKSWLQTSHEDVRARKMYDKAMESLEPLLQRSKKSNLLYYAEKREPALIHKMDHLACFSGGMLALGAEGSPPDVKRKHLEFAKGIAHTCHESYDKTATKLGPESFYFSGDVEARGTMPKQRYYIQRPEVIETYFYMWRITKDQKYRDWGWEAAQAIEKYCRVENGYSGIRDVDTLPVSHDDVQQSFLLAETFKYLYLLFSDDGTISLDEWVFNTEAHPLPILKGIPK